jgi:hypothetical protein
MASMISAQQHVLSVNGTGVELLDNDDVALAKLV